MNGSAVYKAGKLLKVSLDYDDRAVCSVSIHGDFFLYPEERIAELEASLAGVPLEPEALKEKIDVFMSSAEVFGFESNDLVKAIMMAGGKT
ncbi:hypothetical protein HZC09_01445 [Candidatus Micrarchaeota archaeon]|nr:hypothetical protein [Candidatus Micrarchaeota archaeon]